MNLASPEMRTTNGGVVKRILHGQLVRARDHSVERADLILFLERSEWLLLLERAEWLLLHLTGFVATNYICSPAPIAGTSTS